MLTMYLKRAENDVSSGEDHEQHEQELYRERT
jgi:hypothetical protein